MNLLFIDDYYRSFKDQSLLLLKYGFTLDTDNKKKIYDRFGFNHNRHCGFYVSKSNYISYFIPNQGHLTIESKRKHPYSN